MKTRVVSLLLCLLMVLSVFMTGCAEKTDEEAKKQIEEEAAIYNITLSMWVVSEDTVSAETAAAVTAAINEITEDKLKTRLAITYYTKDQYEEKLLAAIEAYDNTAVSAPSTDTMANSNTNADGSFYESKYPELLKNQVDIVYIEGKEMYTTLMDNQWLAPLESYIANASTNAPLQEYISSVMMSAAKLNGRNIYAVPNNNEIGEYTYMLLNKKLVDKYYGSFVDGSVDSFYDTLIYNYLDTVFENDADEYVPIDSTYDDCLKLLAHYWNFNSEDYALLDEFSVFGHLYTDKDTLNRGSIELGYTNLFKNEDFTDAFLKLNKFDADGYFGDAEKSDKEAALKFVTCNLLSLEEYTDEYYPVVVAYPTLTDEDFYNNGMFGVCSKSVNPSRSMEIITYINTNAEVRNTLLYGVKGVHYDTMEREVAGKAYTVAYRLNNDYKMCVTEENLGKSGNLFLVYPTVDLENEENSMAPNAWDVIKKQNYEALISPTLGFEPGKQALNKDLTAYLNALNEDLTKEIDKLKKTDYAKMETLVAELGELLDANSDAEIKNFDVLKAYLEGDFKNLIVEKQDGEEVGVNDLKTLRANLKLAMSTEADKNVYSPYGAYAKWLADCELNVKKK